MNTRKAAAKKPASQQEKLKATIIEAIQDKKGEKITVMNLKQLPDSIADFFILCEATSSTQVKAISENVMEKIKKDLGERPWHIEGMNNLEWVLVDFVDIVVHVFQTERRAFYQLESLWSDAGFEYFE